MKPKGNTTLCAGKNKKIRLKKDTQVRRKICTVWNQTKQQGKHQKAEQVNHKQQTKNNHQDDQIHCTNTRSTTRKSIEQHKPKRQRGENNWPAQIKQTIRALQQKTQPQKKSLHRGIEANTQRCCQGALEPTKSFTLNNMSW